MDAGSLDRLIIENVADLDAGVRRMWQIQELVGGAINRTKSAWAATRDWTTGDDAWNEIQDCSVAPRNWRPSEDVWLRWFSLQYSHPAGNPGPTTDNFWLMRLVGESSTTMGFRFVQEEFGRFSWKKFLAERTQVIAGTRFILDDQPSFYLPVRLEKNALASAIENNDFQESMQPLAEALDYIYDNIGIFELLISEMRGHNAVNANV